MVIARRFTATASALTMSLCLAGCPLGGSGSSPEDQTSFTPRALPACAAIANRLAAQHLQNVTSNNMTTDAMPEQMSCSVDGRSAPDSAFPVEIAIFIIVPGSHEKDLSDTERDRWLKQFAKSSFERFEVQPEEVPGTSTYTLHAATGWQGHPTIGAGYATVAKQAAVRAYVHISSVEAFEAAKAEDLAERISKDAMAAAVEELHP